METCDPAFRLFPLGICAGVEKMSLSFNDKILTRKPVQVMGLRVLLTLAVVVSGFSAEKSWATCSAPSGTLNFPNPLAVQRDAPVGAVIATATLKTTITCNASGNDPGWAWNVYPSSRNVDYGASSITNVRLTNVPGIGIRWSNHSDTTGTTSIWSRKSLNDGTGHRGIPSVGNSVFTDTFELIKLGAVSSTKSPSWVLDYDYKNRSNVGKGKLYSTTATSRDMQVVACSVMQASIPINMGAVKIAEFSGVGSTVREKPIEIPLDCDAKTKVNVTLDGVRHSSGAAGVLALSPSASQVVATGVGLQLLYNNKAVIFGTPIAAGVASNDGAYTIPLVARYYQTANTITEGQANSTATFTMSYQ